MIVLVCGSRDWTDRTPIFRTLDRALEAHGEDLFVLAGGAAGPDSIAIGWARAKGVRHHEERAEWKRFAKAAGAIRNQVMLEMLLYGVALGDVAKVVAYKDGFDPRMLKGGTEDMCKRALDAEVEAHLYELGRWRPLVSAA